MNLNCSPFPIILTERLRLRPLNMDDASALLALRSHPNVHKYLEKTPPKDVKESTKIIKMLNHGIANNQWIFWVISLKNQPELLGTICLWNMSAKGKKADLGYELHPDFQRNGYMQEAVMAILKYGFEVIQLEKIEAMTHQENTSSVKLLLRNNFERVHTDKESKIDWPKHNDLFCLPKARFRYQ